MKELVKTIRVIHNVLRDPLAMEETCLGCSLNAKERVLFIRILKALLGRETYNQLRENTAPDPWDILLMPSASSYLLPSYERAEQEEMPFCLLGTIEDFFGKLENVLSKH